MTKSENREEVSEKLDSDPENWRVRYAGDVHTGCVFSDDIESIQKVSYTQAADSDVTMQALRDENERLRKLLRKFIDKEKDVVEIDVKCGDSTNVINKPAVFVASGEHEGSEQRLGETPEVLIVTGDLVRPQLVDVEGNTSPTGDVSSRMLDWRRPRSRFSRWRLNWKQSTKVTVHEKFLWKDDQNETKFQIKKLINKIN